MPDILQPTSAWRKHAESAVGQFRTLAVQRKQRLLFDDLVGAREQHRRKVEAERLGSLEIDDEFELGRLQHRKVGRLVALENSANVDTGLAIRIYNAGAVADQTAGLVG